MEVTKGKWKGYIIADLSKEFAINCSKFWMTLYIVRVWLDNCKTIEWHVI
jgi:hypothetical protein